MLHASRVTDPIDAREIALRRLPPSYSLALRLRRAGTPADVICEYLGLEPEALDALLRVAEDKLDAAMRRSRRRE